MDSTVKVLDLADFLVCYFNKQGIPLSNLKLQKVLYYIQAWHLVYFEGNPLFEEQPEAWVNGPVYRDVYQHYKGYGDQPIKPEDCSEENFLTTKASLGLTEKQEEFLEEVIKKYGFMEPFKLVYLTHAEKPWNNARKDVGPFDYSDNIISHQSMKEYYEARLPKSH